MPLYDDAPPTDVPDRIDWVSDAWLVSEANVDPGVGFGVLNVAGSDGDGGNGFSTEFSGTGNDDGM